MPLHVEIRSNVAVLTLDDPERRNALGPTMVEDIVAAVTRFNDDESVRALVVTGAGPAFCSGANLGDLVALTSAEGGEPRHVRAIYDGFLAFRNANVPTIAAVNGPAIGAGMNLALACDIRITTPSARFESRFAQIGLHPGGGHVWMLDRIAGPQTTAAMVLLGERIDGARAVELGLAWECVSEESLVERCVAIATRATSVPRDLMAQVKATTSDVPWHTDFDAALEIELERQAWSFAQGYFNERVVASRT